MKLLLKKKSPQSPVGAFRIRPYLLNLGSRQLKRQFYQLRSYIL